MRLKVLLLFSKNSAARHKDKTVTSKNQITRQFYLFTASHWREQACLVPQRSMKIWQFVAVTPGLLPSFERFCSSKKNQTPNSKDAEAGPYCFHQKNTEHLLKNSKDINKHKTLTYCSPRTMTRTLKEKSHGFWFLFPCKLSSDIPCFHQQKIPPNPVGCNS